MSCTHRTSILFLAILLVLSSQLAHGEAWWGIELKDDGSKLEVSKANVPDRSAPIDAGDKFSIKGPPGFDWNSLSVEILNADKSVRAMLTAGGQGDSRNYVLDLNTPPGDYFLRLSRKTGNGDEVIKEFPLKVKTASGTGQGGTGAAAPGSAGSGWDQGGGVGTTDIGALITKPCDADYVIPEYEAKENVGGVVLTPTGNVLSSAVAYFDEDDTLKVNLQLHPDLQGRLKIKRSSPFRQKETVRIIGEGLSATDLGLRRQAAERCVSLEVSLSDFEPSRGEVQIIFITDSGEDLPIGSFEFAVNPLYSGIFSLGGVWTEMVDPDFGLVTDGNNRIIAPENQGEDEFVYALFYTPFVWGKRDVEKGYRFLEDELEKEGASRFEKFKRHGCNALTHINPTVGITLADMDENAIVGLSIDLPFGFLVTFGRHFRKVTVISEESGFESGDVFPGSKDSLPTTSSWENESFIGFSVDLRAMVKLFTAAGGG